MIPVIIIPVYNPPQTFLTLLGAIRSITSIPIIIIDDGSHQSIKIVADFPYVKILKNHTNQGKGYSLIKGFHYAFNHGYTHGITLDADSQHDPIFIPQFLAVDTKISIVYGKRNFNENMPFFRKLSNLLTSKIVTIIGHQSVFDSQCGYRRYRLEDVCKEIFYEKGYQFETEVLIKLLRNGFGIYHIDISTIYAGEHSAVSYSYDTFKFIKMLIKILKNIT